MAAIIPLSSLAFVLIQLKSLVQGAHGQLHVLVVDDDRGLDLACTDHLDIDALFRQGAEHQAGNARMAAHAFTYDRYVADLGIGCDLSSANGWADLVIQQIERTGKVVAVNSEGKVRGDFDGLVLQNHVDL